MLEKIIKHGDGRYTVNEDGEIRNTLTGTIMKQVLSTNKKYNCIRLNGGGHSETYRVHRLVAMAFIENPSKRPEVNHKDGNGLNNTVKNLEWVTRKENMVHSVATNLSSSKLNTEKVREICEIIKSGVKITNANLGKQFGVKHTAISKIRQGKSWVSITKEIYGFGDSTKNTNSKHRRKLTDAQVIEICALLKEENLSAVRIGEKYGVAKTTINDISAGNTYTDVTEGLI